MEIRPYYRKVQFYETDSMAIVHHANYIRWMEEIRVDFMDQIGYPYARCTVEEGIDIALTDVSCQYKGMLRFGDTMRGEMDIIQLTNARLRVRYRMYKDADNTLCCVGESGHFFYNHRTSRPTALKRALPGLYALLDGLCVEE